MTALNNVLPLTTSGLCGVLNTSDRVDMSQLCPTERADIAPPTPKAYCLA